MYTSLYASLCGLLIVWLSLNVIRLRRSERVAYGSGESESLLIARSAQANATEYIPIGMILLFAFEYLSPSILIVHAFGITFLSGRLIHAYGLTKGYFKGRVLGMQLTLFPIIGLCVANIGLLIYKTLSS